MLNSENFNFNKTIISAKRIKIKIKTKANHIKNIFVAEITNAET